MPVIALGALAAVAMAVMALLMLGGFPPIQKLLVGLVSQIPLVGSAVEGWVNGAFNAIATWLASITGDADALISSLFAPHQALTHQIHEALNSTYNALHNIISSVVPNATSALWSQTWGYLQSAFNDIATTGDQVRAYAYGLAVTLGNDIVATSQQIEGWVTSSINDVVAQIEQNISNLTDSVTQRLLAIEQWTTQSITDAYNQVFSNLGNQVASELGGIWEAISTPAESVVQGIAAEYPSVASGLQNIPLTVPGDIVGAITAIGAITIPLTTYVEQCGMPMCNDLSGFGKELQALLGLVGEGAMLAFLIEAILYPETVAEDVYSVGNDVVTPVYDVVRSLVG